MDYIIKGHEFADDIISILQLFYPNETYTKKEDATDNCVVSEVSDNRIYSSLIVEGKTEKAASLPLPEEKSDIKRELKLCLFDVLMSFHKINLPWGALTGVRPAKLVGRLKNKLGSFEKAKEYLSKTYHVREDKIDLCIETVKNQEKVLSDTNPYSVGLYVGIPFCPTRCLYCSFTSYPLKQYEEKTEAYLQSLFKEMEFCSEYMNELLLESIYIGGGTPTSLSEKQLERLLLAISEYFKTPREFTVEAGRPDTITRDKLRIIKYFGIDRISINPQTLNDATLRTIGREHTADDFYRAFEMARQEGFGHINCDVILGLPGERDIEVQNTFEGLKKLSPESLTVHTLAVKRASRLKEKLDEYSLSGYELMERLLSISSEYAAEMELHPYYMYRQKNMLGNFENVSYCKSGHEGLYNIRIMEENQTIIALGCGGSTKIVDRETDRIDRIFNVKSVDDYIARTDEMTERKRAALSRITAERRNYAR